MCTCARVAVAVKSKIERDLIVLSSLRFEARFFCSERLCGCNAGRERCVGTVCEDRRRAESVRWPDASKKSQRMPAGTSVTRGAWTGVKSSQAVVKARDGPLLGWGKPPKHQGEARPRLNTCASPAGPVGQRAATARACLDINNRRGQSQRSKGPHPKSERHKQNSALNTTNHFLTLLTYLLTYATAGT